MKFELLVGRHSNKHGHYKAGDLVESQANLERIYVNKFKRRLDLEIVNLVPPPLAPSVPVPVNVPVIAPSPTKVDLRTSQDLTHSDQKGRSVLGTDVTVNFPIAVDADYRVHQKGAWYYVVDPDEPTKAINAKALKKLEVEEFIKDQLVK